MKTTLFSLFLALSFFACQNNKSTENANSETTVSNQDTSDVLTLNGNAKWVADSATDDNLVAMKNMADMFRILPFPALDEYHMLGNDLQTQISKMTSQCKMTGADHDELHKWLKPIISNVNLLKTVPDTTTAAPLFHKIDKRIDEYRTYFQ